mgnify:CR=1 FL=1
MPKVKYYYNTETCKYEPLKKSTAHIIMDGLLYISLILIGAVCILVIYLSYYDSPNEKLLRKGNEKLVFRLKMLDKEMGQMDRLLGKLQNRDDKVYRTIFEQEPIASSIRTAGIGGSRRYQSLIEQNLESEEFLLKSLTKFDQLKRQMYIQTKSYDELLSLARRQHMMLASIPAITPISLKQSYLSSGFGMRFHPIHRIKKMHTGIDFGARVGTPIYATGAGKVTKVSTRFTGAGKNIEIDHGFGFKTKYFHLSEFNVKVGQRVKRGELIAYSGNTGTSSGPHLHYEVVKNRKKVNPIHYFYRDISDKEFEQLVKLASIENSSM